jgi:hypothetical protein
MALALPERWIVEIGHLRERESGGQSGAHHRLQGGFMKRIIIASVVLVLAAGIALAEGSKGW